MKQVIIAIQLLEMFVVFRTVLRMAVHRKNINVDAGTVDTAAGVLDQYGSAVYKFQKQMWAAAF